MGLLYHSGESEFAARATKRELLQRVRNWLALSASAPCHPHRGSGGCRAGAPRRWRGAPRAGVPRDVRERDSRDALRRDGAGAALHLNRDRKASGF